MFGREKTNNKGKFIKLLILLAVIGGMVFYFFHSKYTIRVDRPILTPEETVRTFYKWYLEFRGHPLLSGGYKKIDYLSSGYKDTLDGLVKEKGIDLLSDDPVLCSGGAPYVYSVLEYDVQGSDARATVNADYYGNVVKIELTLIKEGRYWVIDSITCPEPVTEED